MIDNHPKNVPGLRLVNVHESCTSKVCPECGSMLVEQTINQAPYHHTTRCTSSSYKQCSRRGKCIPRDEPGSRNIFVRGIKQVCDLLQHDNWDRMSEVAKLRVSDKEGHYGMMRIEKECIQVIY